MRRLLGLLLLAALPLTACSDDGSGPNATLEGAYTLRTINGSAVPYTLLNQGGFKVEFVSSTLTLNQGGTFTEVATTRYTDATGVSTDEQANAGTFVRSGNNITLRQTLDGEVSTIAGVWNGDNQLTFTQTDPDFGTFVYVFRK